MHNRANFQFCQFFVVLHKIGHECIMTLHGHFTKITLLENKAWERVQRSINGEK